MTLPNRPNEEVVLGIFKSHVRKTFTEQAKTDYIEMRKAYLKVGELLSENLIFYEKIQQNQEDIKKLITKGWGY